MSADNTTKMEDAAEITLLTSHVVAADYRVYGANGAWGCLANNGAVQIDFTMERYMYPTAVIHKGRDGDAVLKEASREFSVSSEATRYMEKVHLFGVMLTPEAARSIGQFLIEKANEYEDAMSKGTANAVVIESPTK